MKPRPNWERLHDVSQPNMLPSMYESSTIYKILGIMGQTDILNH